MFAWVGNHIDLILGTYLIDVVARLMTVLTPVALSALTLWIGLFGWAVLRNEVPDTVPQFMWKVVKLLLVLSFALSAGVYMPNVVDTANDLSMGLASTFLPDGLDPDTISGPYSLLDRFNDEASQQVADIMKESSVIRLDLVLAGIIFSFGSVIFLCIALFIVTLSKLFITFVLAIGPLFIFCLAWKPTARFFDSWLSMLLNAVVLTWLAFFALGISAFMGMSVFRAIQDGGGFLGGSFNVLGEATRYCVLMFLMAILCFQAPSIATGLTGGAVIQQGIQMMQSALITRGLRPQGKDRSGVGGVVRAGVGAPYTAGHAAGAAVGAAARQASAAKRIPAYLMASIRARR